MAELYKYSNDSITHIPSGRSLHHEQQVDIPGSLHVLGPTGWTVVGIPGGRHGMVELQKVGPQSTSLYRVPMLNCHPTMPAPGSQEAIDAQVARAVGKALHPSAWRTSQELDREAEALAKVTGSKGAKITHETVALDGTRTVVGTGRFRQPDQPVPSPVPEMAVPSREQAAEWARGLGQWTKQATWEELSATLAEMNRVMCEAWGTPSSVVQVGVFERNGTSGFCMRAPYAVPQAAPQPVVWVAGTKLSEVTEYDRSKKVTFRCPLHPEVQWISKEPSRSAWFPATDTGAACPKDCQAPLPSYELVLDYEVIPRG